MSTTNNPNAPLSLDTPIDEDRVRRALGLTSSGGTHQQRPEQARQRHRFVTDGAVPVVMLNRADSDVGALRDKLAAAEHALEAERAAHAATKRSLMDVQAAHQLLQTRLGHSELAHHETLAKERDARRAAEETIAALRAQVMAQPAERPVAKAEAPAKMEPSARVEPIVGPSAEPVAVMEPKAKAEPVAKAEPAAKIRKIRVGATKEPKPVRWWTPSYRAKITK